MSEKNNHQGIGTQHEDLHSDWMLEEKRKNQPLKIPMLIQDLNAVERLKIALEIIESVAKDHFEGKAKMSAKVCQEITKNRIQLNKSIIKLGY